MRALICCESSGVVREAFRAKGFDAWSCDLLPADDRSPHHIQGDAREVLRDFRPDFAGFHPPCTYLCGSGLHWNERGRGWEKTEGALELVRTFMEADCHWYLENPVGIISTRIRPADQYIQPYEFGEDASKKTGLWLNKLPLLEGTLYIPGRVVELPSGKVVNRWANQTDSGQNKLPPSADRWKLRSKTYPGIAKAMADQWASVILRNIQ